MPHRFESPPVPEGINGESSQVQNETGNESRGHVALNSTGEPLPNIAESANVTYGLFTDVGHGMVRDSTDRVPRILRNPFGRRNQAFPLSDVRTTSREDPTSTGRANSTHHHENQIPRLDVRRPAMTWSYSPRVEVARQPDSPEEAVPSMIEDHMQLEREVLALYFPSTMGMLSSPAEGIQEPGERRTGAQGEAEEGNVGNVGNVGDHGQLRVEDPLPRFRSTTDQPVREDRVQVSADELYADPMWPDRVIRGRRQREVRAGARELALQQEAEREAEASEGSSATARRTNTTRGPRTTKRPRSP